MTAKQLVAEEIRALMARRRDSQSDIAKALGRSQSYVSRRINGEQAFDLDDLEAIAALYDVPVTDLFPRANGSLNREKGGVMRGELVGA